MNAQAIFEISGKLRHYYAHTLNSRKLHTNNDCERILIAIHVNIVRECFSNTQISNKKNAS